MQVKCTIVITVLGYTFSYPTVVLDQILQLIAMLNTLKVQYSVVLLHARTEWNLDY